MELSFALAYSHSPDVPLHTRQTSSYFRTSLHTSFRAPSFPGSKDVAPSYRHDICVSPSQSTPNAERSKPRARPRHPPFSLGRVSPHQTLRGEHHLNWPKRTSSRRQAIRHLSRDHFSSLHSLISTFKWLEQPRALPSPFLQPPEKTRPTPCSASSSFSLSPLPSASPPRLPGVPSRPTRPTAPAARSATSPRVRSPGWSSALSLVFCSW